MSVFTGVAPRGDAWGGTWTSKRLPDEEQFSSWAAVCCEAFCPVVVTRGAGGPFHSEVAARRMGAVSFSVFASQAQQVARTAQHARRGGGDLYFLNMPLTDGSTASQGGRIATLRAGDFAIVDSAAPFELSFARDFAQISLALPRDLLASRLSDPAGATAVGVAGDVGVGAVAAAALRAAADSGPLDRAAGSALVDHLCGLVALALGGVTAAARPRGRELLIQAAFDEVERSLSDPDLSPGQVAGRLSISSRYLHGLFADRGTTFGRWVMRRRLEHGHRDLCDPGQLHRSVADIAFANGFTDPSYFTRAFRQRYGMTPRALRAQT